MLAVCLQEALELQPSPRHMPPGKHLQHSSPSWLPLGSSERRLCACLPTLSAPS